MVMLSESAIDGFAQASLRRLCIGNAWDWVLHNNPTHGGYHNNRHMFQVLGLTQYILTRDPDCVAELTPQNAVTPEDVALGLACIFHDFGHSQGAHDDAWNIDTAAKGLWQWYAQSPELPHINEHVVALAEQNIRCTQYPFVLAPEGWHQKVLRDADLVYGVMADPQVILELCVEIKLPLGKLIQDRNEFLDNSTWFTYTGSELATYNRISHMRALEDLVNRDFNQLPSQIQLHLMFLMGTGIAKRLAKQLTPASYDVASNNAALSECHGQIIQAALEAIGIRGEEQTRELFNLSSVDSLVIENYIDQQDT